MHQAWPTDLAPPLEKLSLASARPRRLRVWLAALSADPLESSTPLLRLLDELGRLRIGPRHRLALLEEVRPRVHHLARVLQGASLNLPVRPPDAMRRCAESGQALFEALARGYQGVAAALLSEPLTPVRRQAAAASLQRSADALGERLCLHWLLYTPLDTDLWWRLHRLYACAERHALQTLTVGDPEWPGGESSVRIAYARSLLVASARPNQLRPSALIALYRAAAHWGRWLPLHADYRPVCFEVVLDQDRGPRWSTVEPVVADPDPYRYFDTRPLARALVKTAPGGRHPLSELLLTHLRTTWLAPATRVAPRRAAADRVSVRLGLNAAHACLDRPAATRDAVAAHCLDRGEDGYCLAWPGDTPKALRAGAIIAVGHEDGRWRVGEIRWLARAGGDVRLGVALLPAASRPVRISHGYGETLPTPALWVPLAGGGDTLLVPAAGFRAGARVTVWEGPPRLVRLGVRVAGSADVSRYTLRRD